MTIMSITISQFTIDAYEEIISLWKDCEGIGLSDADSKESIQKQLDRNPGMSFVAYENNKLVGAVLCGHDGRRGYVHHLGVHQDYRRQGIARSLIIKCLSMLASVGIKKCHTFVFNSNNDGVNFWRNLDWSQRMDISVFSTVL
jgi:putative acetyltransferase